MNLVMLFRAEWKPMEHTEQVDSVGVMRGGGCENLPILEIKSDGTDG